MSERKSRARYIPLRVRFRPTTESRSSGREQNIPVNGTLSSRQLTARVSETDRHAKLISELLRLCDLLRTDLGLDELLQQIASSIVACTGFRSLAINQLDEGEKMLRVVAIAGATEEDLHLLHKKPFSVEILFNLMRPQFRMSQSYFIPHEYASLPAEAEVVTMKDADREKSEAGLWHPEDLLVVPLYSPRGHELLGCLLLDDPEDNKIPTTESIEVLELFAHKAALAIDNARLFHEREQERTHRLQHGSEQPANETIQQEQQLSQAISDVVSITHTISECAALLSKTIVDAVDIVVEAQTTVDRAVEGMSKVREASMQSARAMKTLGESSHESNEMTQAMTDLATRMHILSLNAAIEATRAGEHGQGFLVIAQEIRTLAKQCSDGTRKVGAYIHTLQHETGMLSQNIEQNTQQIILQTELVIQAGILLETINLVTEQLTNLIQNICTAAESQSKSSQTATNTISEIFCVKK